MKRFPAQGLAPLLGGLGLTLAGLGLAWGPAFIVVALPLLLMAALSWYRAAVRENPGSPQTRAAGAQVQPAAVPTSGPDPAHAGTRHVTAPAKTIDRQPEVRSETPIAAAATIVVIVLAVPVAGAVLQRLPWIGARLNERRS